MNFRAFAHTKERKCADERYEKSLSPRETLAAWKRIDIWRQSEMQGAQHESDCGCKHRQFAPRRRRRFDELPAWVAYRLT